LSSVATRCQLGFFLQAGSLIVPFNALTPQGTCESAMNCPSVRSDVGRKRGSELRLVEEQKAVLRGQGRRHGGARQRVFDQRSDRFAVIGREGRGADRCRDLGVVADF
jgi:hypothetical protein